MQDEERNDVYIISYNTRCTFEYFLTPEDPDVALITSDRTRRNCDHASLLVGWLVCSWRWSRFLEKYKSDFHETWLRCSASVTNATTKVKVKVKVKGHSSRARRWQNVNKSIPEVCQVIWVRSSHLLRFDLSRIAAVC